MRKIAVIFFLLLTVPCLTSAQNINRRVDSLSMLVSSTPDTLLPRLFYEMSMDSRFTNSILGIQYALKAQNMACKLGDVYYQVKALQALAFNERISKMPDASIRHYKEALALAQEHDIRKLESECCNSLARIYQEQDSLELAYEYNDKAFDIAEELNDSLEWSDSYMNYGIILHSEKKYELAIGYLKESFELREKLFDHHTHDYIAPLWHIMDIYMETEEYHKAMNVARSILDGNTDNDWHELLSRVWYKMAQVYYKNSDLDSAVIVGRLSLRESIASMEPHRVDLVCKLLDSIYIAQGDYDSAAEICRDYIVICDTLFNIDLNYQIKTIQFTSEYLDHERYIAQERQNHRLSLAILAVIILSLIGSGWFFYVMMRRNRRIKRLNRILTNQRGEMDHSLRYAHALQRSVLPDAEDFGSVFSDKFLLYIPRDIVSGDFYWRFSDSRHEMLVVADCTGHGIPGAMLTMLGTTILHDIANSGVRGASQVLEKLRAQIKYLMAVNSLHKMQDGMDISLIIVDRQTMEMEYAGAFNNLVYIRNGEMKTIKACRCPIGAYIIDVPFKSDRLQLQKDDEIYLMSDGYSSQFGGEDNSKLGQRKLLEMILANHQTTMEQLGAFLKDYFYEWKGSCDSVDDVTIAGFRV